MRNIVNRNFEVYQRYGQYKKNSFPDFHRRQQQKLERKDHELQTLYPGIYKQHYQQTKSKNITDVFNIQFNEFGEIQDIVQKNSFCSFHQQQKSEGLTMEN